jgi:antitoxin ParD1/3/4
MPRFISSGALHPEKAYFSMEVSLFSLPFEPINLGAFICPRWQSMAETDILLSSIFRRISMSLNVSLPPELETRVRQRVESGMYGSASEVIREALRLFEAYEQVKTAKLDSLRQDIAEGLNEAKNGRAKEIDFSTLKQQGRQLLKARKAGA